MIVFLEFLACVSVGLSLVLAVWCDFEDWYDGETG